MARIAHIRTWTYITHRGDWVEDSAEWQDRARASRTGFPDALHEGSLSALSTVGRRFWSASSLLRVS